MNVVGCDIGGANLKCSDARRTLCRPFPLWRQPERLSDAIAQLLHEFPDADCLAVTMTGELADCFLTKAEGVDAILTAIEQAAQGLPVAVWQTGGEFVSPADARQLVPLVAAANWHAQATWAARLCPAGNLLIIDTGSTTTDVIPLELGQPMPAGRTDLERMATGELLYLGSRRTPVCTFAETVPIRGHATSLAREIFATIWDVALVRQCVADDPNDCDTADGRPATREFALHRLARSVCSDRDELAVSEIEGVADELQQAALNRIRQSIERVIAASAFSFSMLVTSGSGEFLIEGALESLRHNRPLPERVSLRSLIGAEHSHGICAYALACLGAERL